MTQAFNLSQFANNVNSSGLASLTTGVTGTLPIANGGTGSATASLVAGTNISISGTFPNQTITNTASSGIAGIGGQAFTSNGTFTIPAGVTLLKVTVVGGGGGGATSTGNYAFTGCGGGGGGGSAIKFLTSVTAGNTLAVTIGGAGSAGSTGGTSSVASGTQSITTISATGGSGGTQISGGNSWDPKFGIGGTGGIGSNGDANIRGGVGGVGIVIRTDTVCGTGQGGTSGAGGNTILGGGGLPVTSGTATSLPNTGSAGNTGGAYGSGGSGAINAGQYSTGYTGGSGAAGIVIFEW